MGTAERADLEKGVSKVKNGKSLKQGFLGIEGIYRALPGGKTAGFQ